MRIVMPIHSFEPGGVERVALRLAERWRAGGEQVTVVLGRDEGLCRHEAPLLDYRRFPEPFPTARWETLWMILSLYRFLSTETVDVLFCPGNTYTVVCVAMSVLLGERCPPVLVKISNDLDRADLSRPLRPLYRLWTRLQGSLLDHFVALADPMLPDIMRGLGVDSRRASVIADPALEDGELERLAQEVARSRQGPACTFLSVGRLVPQKNHALLIEAFAHHGRPGDRLVIAGEGPERAKLERLVDNHRLAGRVALIGHSDDIPGLLTQADVFVLSSDYEGVPAAVIEALAAGLPIAATDCCASMGWLVQHGRFGVTARSGDREALGSVMNLARQMEPPRREMAEFAGQFTLRRASAAYLGIMRALSPTSPGASAKCLQSQVREWRGHGV